MAALPYMPLFVADYLADTAHLSTQEHGAYLLLLMNYWQRGEGLPDDDKKLAKIARLGPREWLRVRDTLSEFFTIADGTWLNSRVDRELARVHDKSLKSKAAAQASVQRRFGKRSADVEPTDTQAHTDKKKLPTVVKKAAAFSLPSDIPQEAWDGYEEMRRKKGKPMTDRARGLAVKELRKLAEEGHAPGSVLNQSTLNSWQGLFPIKETGRNGNGNGYGNRPSAWLAGMDEANRFDGPGLYDDFPD